MEHLTSDSKIEQKCSTLQRPLLLLRASFQAQTHLKYIWRIIYNAGTFLHFQFKRKVIISWMMRKSALFDDDRSHFITSFLRMRLNGTSHQINQERDFQLEFTIWASVECRAPQHHQNKLTRPLH